MTTVREARIEAARKALYLHGRDEWLDPTDGPSMAEDVVDALFKPDPMIDNAQVPDGH